MLNQQPKEVFDSRVAREFLNPRPVGRVNGRRGLSLSLCVAITPDVHRSPFVVGFVALLKTANVLNVFGNLLSYQSLHIRASEVPIRAPNHPEFCINVTIAS